MKRSTKKILFLALLTCVLLGATKTIHSLFGAPLSADGETFTVEVEDLNVFIDGAFGPTATIENGETLTKKIKIENKTNGDMFVRVMILPTLETSAGKVFSPRLGKEVLIGGMTTSWVAGEDGYYYYTKVIEGSEKSEPLIEDVTLHHVPSGGQEELSIQLKVESINTSKDGFVEAWWQGVEPTAADEPYYSIYTALDSQTTN
ncbi:hypothetical protein I6N95_04345 [Vagococcus sp. BWB3-3]|uniref:Uncharacterized protein n=1 Tax=Vagococcus allomyrinae TaxID=2794353 RepID=A0A940PCI8_9ENTE|nr:hypothetical protein [Vagococcus allomyrinae]MBP1040238.1 hypothetical protein [Vagococcus allomyrinae]